MGIINEEFVWHERNGKYLFIYPNVPYWLAVNEAGKRLLELFHEFDDLEAIKTIYENKYNAESYSINNAVNSLYSRLEEHYVLDKSKKPLAEWQGKIDTAGINMTKSCNLRCGYCYADAGENNTCENEIGFDEIKKYLDGIKEFCTDNCFIQFTGGEPLLRKDLLFKSIRYVREIGLPKITVNTNGILLDDKIAEFFVENKVDNVTISLDSVNNELHDKFRGKGSFQEAKKAIKILKEHGLRVTASITVHKDNFNVLQEFINYCKNEKIEVFTSPLFPTGRCKENAELTCVKLDKMFAEILKYYSKGLFSDRDLNGTFFQTIILPLRDLTKRHYCGAAMSSIFMDANGDIYPCTNTVGVNYFKGGNIREDSFKNIWIDSEGFRKVRNDISVDNIVPCNKCEVRYICAGFCRGVNYQATGKVHAPFIWCNEVKKSIIEGMWTIAEFPNVFKNSKDKFNANTYEVV
ncbi:radical SAM/SPASM domain-containing protein [uncultured Clostridium sp.]|uniref:radical SAM/SPASM domain-containing protein n=1 Tax=uncultured Clostridium sp. TaxID=59620 RepID=UPI002590368A|nr:radical SAM protein [uncultured Clostridium sp.]MDU1348756.1 radical SAM protein [Clostridium argentinense]